MLRGRTYATAIVVATLLATAVPGVVQGATQVVLGPGDDFQAIVDTQPAGTTYLVPPGIHRAQSIVPHHGDRFIGEPGAVMSGARVLTDWQRSDNGFWYVDDQTQQGSVHGEIADGGNRRDAYAEELFVDGERWKHVGSLDDLGPGRWFFSYGTDRIWIGRNPALLGTIETSVQPFAIGGRNLTPAIRDVTVENLVVERYATPTQRGAIGMRAALDWTIRRVTARQNHGAGVRLGPGGTLVDSKVHGNGQIGVLGGGLDPKTGVTGPLAVRGTEIAHNFQLDFRFSYESGGAKLKIAPQGVTVENSWVHDNAGHGLWLDNGVYAATVRSNRVEDNAYRGIFYEVSYGAHPIHGGGDARIYWNEIWRNGGRARLIGEFKGGGVAVSNSREVRVFGNAMAGNYGGVLLMEAGGRTPHTQLVRVVGNDMRYSAGWTGLFTRNHTASEAEAYHTNKGNIFSDNTYRLADGGRGRFFGVRRPIGITGWKHLGHDLNSRYTDTSRLPQLPARATPFRQAPFYGAR